MSYSTSAQANIARCDLFNVTANATTNLLGSDVKSTYANSIWLVYGEFSATGNILVKRTNINTTNVTTAKIPIATIQVPVLANIVVTFAETINFQVDTGMTLYRFCVLEIAPITINPGS